MAVDYLLAERLGRMPSVQEAIEEAKQILGEGGATSPDSEPPDGAPRPHDESPGRPDEEEVKTWMS
jgi:hypothetical protein